MRAAIEVTTRGQQASASGWTARVRVATAHRHNWQGGHGPRRRLGRLCGELSRTHRV